MNLLGNFASALQGQLLMLRANEYVNRGHAFYEELVHEHKKKEDEKRFITQ